MGHKASIWGVISLLGALTIVVALPIIGFGDVPQQISFQGYLTDDLGNPLDGVGLITFSIYDLPDEGTALWGETQTVSVVNGIYNVQLGQDPAGNPFPDTFFNGPHWLGVTVESDLEMTPRQPITSVFFALKAKDTETLVGQTIEDLNTAYVNIGEKDVITSAMVAPNSLISTDLATNSVTFSEIAPGAVGTSEIVDGSVSPTDLAEDYVNTSGDTMTGTLELTENLRLPHTTSTTGIIRSGSNTLIHTYGTGNFFAGENAGNLSMTGDHNTASGLQALYSNTEGHYNTANGNHALYANTTGVNNAACGNAALYSNTTGPYNTAIGSVALYANTIGGHNTACGYQALRYNTEGNYNTASGSEALRYNTTGYDNTASGFRALYLNATGYDNTANGYQALFSNSEGRRNTASGNEALFSNTTGYGNTATGDSALYSNVIGHENTAIGDDALYSNTEGHFNTATGDKALYLNTTGGNNTAIGAVSLRQNTTGEDNTAIGGWALNSNTEGNLNTASGYMALYSNTTGNDNSASGGYSLRFNTTGYDNSASGSNALRSNTTGIHGTALGARAGYTNTTGNGNTFIGCDSDASAEDLINATAIGYSAVVNGTNRVRIGNTYVSQIGGNVGWSNLSDIRGKEGIVDITLGLDFINSLRPVEFSLIDGNGGVDLGFTAQDIEAILGTGYNIIGIGGDSDRTLSLRYTDFIAPMVRAIQEQQGLISDLRVEIESLKTEMKRMKVGR